MTAPTGLIVLLAGCAAGVVAWRLRLPGGGMLASLIAAGIAAALLQGPVVIGTEVRFLAQVLVGASVGSGLTRLALRRLRGAMVPAVLAVGGGLSSSILIGLGLSHLTDLPLTTALLSTAPGGSSEMAAAAFGLGADPRIVIAIHAARQTFVLAILPVILPLVVIRQQRQRGRQPRHEEEW